MSHAYHDALPGFDPRNILTDGCSECEERAANPLDGLTRFYAKANRLLIDLYRRDVETLREQWQDEAAQAALAGRPERARYIEGWAARL